LQINGEPCEGEADNAVGRFRLDPEKHAGNRVSACLALLISCWLAYLSDFTPLQGGLELLKPDDLLQKWPVSKRVNSSRATADDPTLI
jgi:hypothetical protein